MQASNEILHAYLQVHCRMISGMRGNLGDTPLTYLQTLVLVLLDSDGPMPISALAKATGNANSTISGVVDRLEACGFLRRIRSEQDRRVIFVDLTDQYHSVREQGGSSGIQRFNEAMKALDEDQLRAVLNGLSILNQALQEVSDS